MKYLPFIAGIVLLCGIAVVAGCRSMFKGVMRQECGFSLKQNIGLRCREYAMLHDGQFPNKWADLGPLEPGSTWPKVFRCPSTDHNVGEWDCLDTWSDYHLLPGRTINDPPHTILVNEPLSNHSGQGANLLFVDGSTTWWAASQVLSNQPPPPKAP
jgi:prepilin-type processing-associated H-X9-DG protein